MLRHTLASCLVGLASVVLLLALPTPDEASAKPKPTKGHSAKQCRPQKPQAFLIRKNYLPNSNLSPAQLKKRHGAHQKALDYRTKHYGYVEGFGSPKINSLPPTAFEEHTTFFGLSLQMHKKVVPALKCVEKEIKSACKSTPYTPVAVGGFWDHNTFRGGEVTNHLYGIALDIDPHKNPCCNCVEPWRSHPLCQNKVSSPYERMAMPKCWVQAFEKFGFYWLGDHVLEDTMHYEFLGDPDKIYK